jgi:trehalose 6-phosphate phosphatase
MEYLFRAWKDFSSAIETSPHILLLSDYDGTLTPIVSRPEEALLSPRVEEKLHTLSRKPAYTVGIISGRSMKDLKSMVSIDGVYYAGNHGLEIEGPHLRYINESAQADQSLMKKLAGEMSLALEHISGVIIEDKGLGLSVHYRLVSPEDEYTVVDTFRRITRHLMDRGEIRVTSGKKVYEVRPPIDWHKGKAVEAIVREIKAALDLDNLLTIYLGDDVTDEDAFKVLQRPNGWSIFIGSDNPLSTADYYLDSTSEVEELLSRLIALK